MVKSLTIICLLLAVAFAVTYSIMNRRCESYNILVAKEQADGSIQEKYFRICSDDYGAFNDLLK